MSNRFSDPVIGSDLTWTALVVNRPVAGEQPSAKSADAIGAQDAILPHNFSQLLTLGLY